MCCWHYLLSFQNKNISFKLNVVKLKLKQNSNMEKPQSLDLSHHKRFEYCENRLNYRNGRKCTAVKTYTIVNESRHLLVFGVPRINLHQEVKHLFGKYGKLSRTNAITDTLQSNDTVEIELFTDCYYVAYDKIHNARKAKAMIDRMSFYGGILHVSYAPEYETVDDLKEKLAARKRDVRFRTRINRPNKKLEQQS